VTQVATFPAKYGSTCRNAAANPVDRSRAADARHSCEAISDADMAIVKCARRRNRLHFIAPSKRWYGITPEGFRQKQREGR
jgi:hypothetical protein